MATTLTMPKLSPTMTEGVIAKWHKKEGEFVKPDELLFEVATDKATVEYNALDGGWLRKIVIFEGDKANVGDPLALFTETKDEALPATPAKAAPVPTPAADLVVEKQVEEKKAPPKPAATPVAPQKLVSTGPTTISPYAKKLAEQSGLNVEGIVGTGPSGRIMSRDLENAKAAPIRSAKKGPSQPTEESLSPMRKVIGQRLQYSKQTIPHFYIRQLVDASALLSLREQLKHSGFAVTVNDLIVKATALCLKNHPNLRTTFDDTKGIVYKHPHADICVAVTIEGGLITPIIFQAESTPLLQLSKEIKELADKARTGKLQPHEYQGGCFTISNLGMFGTTDFMAIVNPPQCAILAVGAALPHAFVKNGQIVPGQALNLTLSCDHRVVDGSDAAKFMKDLKDILENPIKLIIE